VLLLALLVAVLADIKRGVARLADADDDPERLDSFDDNGSVGGDST
jgi:hypothetical protein